MALNAVKNETWCPMEIGKSWVRNVNGMQNLGRFALNLVEGFLLVDKQGLGIGMREVECFG